MKDKFNNPKKCNSEGLGCSLTSILMGLAVIIIVITFTVIFG